MALPTLPPDYEIKEEVGRGAKGVVYRAFSTRLQRDVAVKVLIDAEESELIRFQQEAKLLERFYHPNIVTYIESADNYLVLEFLGGNLYELLRGRPGFPETCRIFAQICRGLIYIHSQGLVHRDLKPENILLTREWVPKITDFGTARELGATSKVRLTMVGTVVGTWGYLAPEQIQTNTAGPAADMYALGVCLYEAATGRPPFEAKTMMAMAIAHIEETPPPPRSIHPDVPGELDRLILRLLKKAPEERPDASEVAARLDEIAMQLTPPGRAEVANRASQAIQDRLAARLREGPLNLVITGNDAIALSTLTRELVQSVPQHAVHRLSAEGNDHSNALAGVWVALGGELEELWSAFEAGGPQAAAMLLRRRLRGILLIDDYARLDATTQAVVSYLVRMPPPSDGGWLVAWGPGTERASADVIELPPIADDDLIGIAEEVLGAWPEGPAELTRELREWLLEKSAGSVGRLRLLLLSLRGRNAISFGWLEQNSRKGTWMWAKTPQRSETFWESVMGEIGRLDKSSRRLVRAACLLDEPLPYSLLLACSGLKEEEVEESLDRLVQLGLLEEIWTAKGDSYRFSAREVKDELAKSFSEATSLRAHAQIALGLEQLQASAAQRGWHLACAGQHSDALPLLQEAAQQAQERGLYHDALGHWESALVCAAPADQGDPDLPAYFLTRALECLGRSDRAEEAEALFQKHLELFQAASPMWRLEVLRWWGVYKARSEAPRTVEEETELRAILEAGLRAADFPVAPRDPRLKQLLGSDLAPTLASIYLALASTLGEALELETVYLQAAVDLLEGCQDAFLVSLAYRLLGALYRRRNQFDRAREYLKDSLRRSPALAVQHRLTTLTELGASCGRSESAFSCYQEALTLAEELGELQWQTVVREELADLYWQEGDTGAAVKLLRAGLETLRAANSPDLDRCLLRLGELCYVGGLREEAETLLTEASLDQIHARGLEAGRAQFALGWLCWEEERLDEATQWLTQALDRQQEATDFLAATRTVSLLSKLARSQNRMGEAMRRAEEAQKLAPADAPIERGLALAARGFVSLRLKHRQAFADLQEAYTILSLPAPEGPVERCYRLAVLVELEEALERAQPISPEQPEGRKKTSRVELEAEALAPDQELEVWGPPEQRLPLRTPVVRIGGPAGVTPPLEANDLMLDQPRMTDVQWVLKWRNGNWTLSCPEGFRVHGVASKLAVLKVGDTFELAGTTFQLGRASEPQGWLEGLSPPHAGQRWGLRASLESWVFPIGRAGGRANRIELSDPSISPAHATLHMRDGRFSLRQDGVGDTLRNGFPLAPDDEAPLLDGDLVRLGNQLLRFRGAAVTGPTTSVSVLTLCMGSTGERLQEAFRILDESLKPRGGRLLPYSGVALMAVFQDGNHAWKALDVARNLRGRLKFKNIASRIGIHTGPARLGSGPVRFAEVEEVALRAYDVVGSAGIFLSSDTFAQLPLSVTQQQIEPTANVDLYRVVGAEA